jgi:hypothetical protein
MSRCWGGTFCRAPAPCFQVHLSILLHLRCSKFILLCRFERRVGHSKKRPNLHPAESIIDFSPSQDRPTEQDLPPGIRPQHVTQAYTPAFEIHPLGAADQHQTHTFDPPGASDRPNKRPKTKAKAKTTEKPPRLQPAPEAPPLEGPYNKPGTSTHHQQKQSAPGPLPGTSQQPATPAPPPTGPSQKKPAPPAPPLTGPGKGPVPGTSQKKLPAPDAPPPTGPSQKKPAPPAPPLTGPGRGPVPGTSQKKLPAPDAPPLRGPFDKRGTQH